MTFPKPWRQLGALLPCLMFTLAMPASAQVFGTPAVTRYFKQLPATQKAYFRRVVMAAAFSDDDDQRAAAQQEFMRICNGCTLSLRSVPGTVLVDFPRPQPEPAPEAELDIASAPETAATAVNCSGTAAFKPPCKKP